MAETAHADICSSNGYAGIDVSELLRLLDLSRKIWIEGA